MGLRSALVQLYRVTSAFAEPDSQAGATRLKASGSVSAVGDDALMATQDYRAYVAEQSQRRPSQIFENRSTSHATVVIEHLLNGADAWIHFVTHKVNPSVYGSPEIIAAARAMLGRNNNARIVLLAENNVDRLTHPFFATLDAEPGIGERIKLQFVPAEVQQTYSYNFGVNDHSDYRFEASREHHEAIVQFGGEAFAQSLENTFQSLLGAATDPRVA